MRNIRKSIMEIMKGTRKREGEKDKRMTKLFRDRSKSWKFV